MVLRSLLIGFLLSGSVYGPINGQVAIIAHPDVPVTALTKQQLLDLYTGDQIFWASDDAVVLFDQKNRDQTKKQFYSFLGKSTSRMKSLWLKHKLSGEGNPPRSITDASAMLQAVRTTSGSIGYLPGDQVTPDIKVLLIIP